MQPADVDTQPPPRPVVRSPDDAERLVAEVGRSMEDLVALLDREATEIGGGRIAAGLASADAKAALTATYLRGLEAAKANAVALARFTPLGLSTLRTAQVRLRDAALRNQAILATARAVSEGLVRSLSDEMARLAQPEVYGRGGRPTERTNSGPLMVSRRL